MNQFECRKSIALSFAFQNKLVGYGLNPRTNAAKGTSSICRAVNVVFSDQFINQFLTLNDQKTQKDHEDETNFKDFWIQALEAHNLCCNISLVDNAGMMTMKAMMMIWIWTMMITTATTATIKQQEPPGQQQRHC